NFRTFVSGCCLGLFRFACQRDNPTEANWQSLSGGKSRDGWKSVGADAPLTMEDSMRVLTMTKGTPNSYLITEKECVDGILEGAAKRERATTNSGIQTRSQLGSAANDGKGRVYGRQVEIAPTPRAWTGGIYDEARRGWLYPLDLN